jgi:two-component system, LytTR family, sensor kinase
MTQAQLVAYQLSSRQKWQLALSVFVIYWPVRIYLNVSQASWAWAGRWLPFWLLEIPLSLGFFYIWLSMIGWLQQRAFERFGNDEGFLIKLNLPAQLAMLLIASTLAVGFNASFQFLGRGLNDWLESQVPFYRDQAEARYRGQMPAGPPPKNRPMSREQRDKMNTGITVMAMLSAFYLSANRRAYQRMRDVEGKAQRLEKENAQAQLAALKNQVNPHFLFNSLSILSSLVQLDPDLSEKFIDQLSRAYRYILEQKDNERILLKTELEFIQSYTFLLKIRFEEKFALQLDVPDNVRGRFSVAPLTLQLLVENAVKHNRMSAREPLTVSIMIEGDCLVVSNPIQLRPQAELSSTGVGIENIINRYALLTNRPVWVGEHDGAFVVKIPLLQ